MTDVQIACNVSAGGQIPAVLNFLALSVELQKLLEQSSKMGQRNKLLRFVTASEDEGDLRKLEEDIKRAFQQFQVLPFIWREETVVNKSQTVRTVDQGLRVFDIQERQLVSVLPLSSFVTATER